MLFMAFMVKVEFSHRFIQITTDLDLQKQNDFHSFFVFFVVVSSSLNLIFSLHALHGLHGESF